MLTPSEIQTIHQNVGISADYVRDMASSHPRYDEKSIRNLCLDYKSKQLLELFNNDEIKTCFWTTTPVPLEQFGNQQYKMKARKY